MPSVTYRILLDAFPPLIRFAKTQTFPRNILLIKGVFICVIQFSSGARGGTAGWGNALQVGTSRFGFPMVSQELIIDVILEDALGLGGPTQPLTETSTRKVKREERKPTRCNNIDDLLSIVVVDYWHCLNMFRASLCPSSGERPRVTARGVYLLVVTHPKTST